MPDDNRLLAATPRTMLRRRANHGRRDRATIDAIIDQALVCHVGFIDEGSPIRGRGIASWRGPAAHVL